MTERDKTNKIQLVRGRILIEDTIRVGQSYRLSGPSFEALLPWNPRPALALTVTDKEGRLFRARCRKIGTEEAELLVYEDMGTRVPSVEITLLQALPQRERMKFIIEKATELGVSSIVPFECERSIKEEDLRLLQDKTHRWQVWALKASLQSRRPSIPTVERIMPFLAALSSCHAGGLKLILSEHHRSPHIREALVGSKATDVVCMVGPEGGFTEGELKEAEARGFIPVSTGPTILRTETAAIFAVGVTAYELMGRG